MDRKTLGELTNRPAEYRKAIKGIVLFLRNKGVVTSSELSIWIVDNVSINLSSVPDWKKDVMNALKLVGIVQMHGRGDKVKYSLSPDPETYLKELLEALNG